MEDVTIIRSYHDAPGDALERGHDAMIAAEMSMCRGIMGYLQKDFPGYAWKVMADFRQGIAAIKLPTVMSDTLWYIIPLSKIATSYDFQRMTRNAAGELLERYGLRRGKIQVPEMKALEAKRPWLFKNGILDS